MSIKLFVNKHSIFFSLTCFLITLILIPKNIIFPKYNIFNNCIHFQIFGFQCPGCGFTRASYDLLHLNINTAFSYNPAVFFILPIFLIEFLNTIISSVVIVKTRYFLYFSFLISLLFIYIFRIFNFFHYENIY
jgi:hypothetical protein